MENSTSTPTFIKRPDQGFCRGSNFDSHKSDVRAFEKPGVRLITVQPHTYCFTFSYEFTFTKEAQALGSRPLRDVSTALADLESSQLNEPPRAVASVALFCWSAAGEEVRTIGDVTSGQSASGPRWRFPRCAGSGRTSGSGTRVGQSVAGRRRCCHDRLGLLSRRDIQPQHGTSDSQTSVASDFCVGGPVGAS